MRIWHWFVVVLLASVVLAMVRVPVVRPILAFVLIVALAFAAHMAALRACHRRLDRLEKMEGPEAEARWFQVFVVMSLVIGGLVLMVVFVGMAILLTAFGAWDHLR